MRFPMSNPAASVDAPTLVSLRWLRLGRRTTEQHCWPATEKIGTSCRLLGLFLGPLLLLPGHAEAGELIHPQLPPEVDMNRNAGRGGMLFVTLTLGSGDQLPFVVDTGAAHTLMDRSFEPKLGNRLGTVNVSHFADTYVGGVYAAPKLYLGDALLVTASNIWTYDFTNQLSSRAGRQIKGILGMDCLKHYCIQLDFEAGKLRFLDPDHLDIEKLGKAFPITFPRGGRPFIHHCSLAGGASANPKMDSDRASGWSKTRELPVTYALIDTGCSYDGRVEKGALQGHDSGNVLLQNCTWDGEPYTNLRVQVAEHANLLGLRFLARHLVTLDFLHRKLYLKRTSIGPLAGEREGPQPNPQGGANGRQPVGSGTNRASAAASSRRSPDR